MASNDHSPSTPLGSESSFSLDGFPREKTPLGEERGTEPPRPPRSRSASKKLVQAVQRSRRQRAPGRCPRQLGRRGMDLGVEPAREPEKPTMEDPEGAVRGGERAAGGARLAGSLQTAVCPQAVPGQGLRYLEHVCQMLERLARLQQDNRLLRQQATDGRHTRPDTTVRAERMWWWWWWDTGRVVVGVPAQTVPLLLTHSPPRSCQGGMRLLGGVRGSGRAPARTAKRQVSGVGGGGRGLCPARPPHCLCVPLPTQHPTPGCAGGRGGTLPAPPACWTPPRPGRAPRHPTRYGLGGGGVRWGATHGPPPLTDCLPSRTAARTGAG
uniref:DUF4657 domain-containing protein n=1 Tax=Falco tinnunculus TaxID=100819 RepID=A0A8C4UA80_FALTI